MTTTVALTNAALSQNDRGDDADDRSVPEIYVPFSLSLIPLTWSLRRIALRAATSPYFAFVFLALILVNSVFLAMFDPVNLDSPGNVLLAQSDVAFLILFTIEMVIRVVAFGFAWEGPNTYLRNPWYVLDFLVTGFGWVALALSANVVFASAARLARLLRVLRVVRLLPGLSWMSTAMVRSAPQLVTACLVLLLFFVIINPIGLIFFAGALAQRCVLDSDNITVLPSDLEPINRFCALPPYPGRLCPPGSNCQIIASAEPIMLNFDNMLMSSLTLFSALMLNQWTDIMYALFDTNGIFVVFYFVIIVAVGAFILLNTFVAILTVNVTIARQLHTQQQHDAEVKLVQEMSSHQSLIVGERSDQYRRRRLALYLKRRRIKRRASVEMRLILSYERMHHLPGYSVCSASLYLELFAKHQANYQAWRALITPILDFNERLAAAGRRRAAKQLWLEQQSSFSSGRGFVDRPDALITPPFVLRELQAQADSAQLSSGRPTNVFARADSSLARMMGHVLSSNMLAPAAGSLPNAPRWRRALFALTKSRGFEMFMFCMIIFSTVALCAEFFDQPAWMFAVIYISNATFVAIFALELTLKVAAGGPRWYLHSPQNCFDGAVALAGVLELAIQSTNQAVALALRVIRIFRVMRLVRYNAQAQQAADTVVKAWLSVLPFSILLFLWVYLVALVGMQLFGGQLEINALDYDCTPAYRNYPHCPPHENFDTFLSAFVTSFQLISGSDWVSLMLTAVGGTGWAAALFFAIVVGLSQLVLLNLLLGVLIDVFLSVSEQARLDGKKKFIPELDPTEALQKLRDFIERRKNEALYRELESHPSALVKTLCGLLTVSHPVRAATGKLVLTQGFWMASIGVSLASVFALFADYPGASPDRVFQLQVANACFVALFLCEIALKSIAFGFSGHAGAYFETSWNKLDLGLVCMYICSIPLAAAGQLQAARIIWATRPLRLIMGFQGTKIIAAALQRAASPITKLGFLLALMFVVAAVISVQIWGGQLWACFTGEFDVRGWPVRNYTVGMCRPEPLYGLPASECTSPCSGYWANPTYPGGGVSFSFDSFPEAVLLLFEISTAETWTVPQAASSDCAGPGFNPVRDVDQDTGVLFVLLVLVFNVVMLQIIVAVVVDAFIQMENERAGSAFMTRRQLEWVELQRLAVKLPFRAKNIAPEAQPFKTAHVIVTSAVFKMFMGVVILLYAGLLCSLWAGASPEYWEIFNVASSVLGSFYLAEAGLQLAAFGTRAYLARRENILSLTICLAVVLGWILPEWKMALQVIICFKATRLAYWSPRAQHLLATLTLSLPLVFNVGGILVFFFFFFAALGVAVFGSIDTSGGGYSTLDSNGWVNFGNFGLALVTLFRMATGDWISIMHDLVLGAGGFGYVYGVAFTIGVNFVVLNLIVAVIIKEIEADVLSRARGRSSSVTRRTLREYAVAWADVRFDFDEHLAVDRRERAESFSQVHMLMTHVMQGLITGDEYSDKCYLPATELPALLLKLPRPLGLAKHVGVSGATVIRLIRELKIPVDEFGRVEFHQVLQTLLDHVVLEDKISKVMEGDLVPGKGGAGVTQELVSLLEVKHPKVRQKRLSTAQQQQPQGVDRASELIARELMRLQVRRFLKRKRRREKAVEAAAIKGGGTGVG